MYINIDSQPKTTTTQLVNGKATKSNKEMKINETSTPRATCSSHNTNLLSKQSNNSQKRTNTLNKILHLSQAPAARVNFLQFILL